MEEVAEVSMIIPCARDKWEAETVEYLKLMDQLGWAGSCYCEEMISNKVENPGGILEGFL